MKTAFVSVLLARAVESAVATPNEVGASAPAVETPVSPETPVDLGGEQGKEDDGLLSFVGVSFAPEAFGKIERQWDAAKGRIRAKVSERMDYLTTLAPDAEDRRKSKLKAGRNVVDEIHLTTNPKQVLAVAKEMTANKLISEGDAATWVAYVTLAEAFRMASGLGRLK